MVVCTDDEDGETDVLSSAVAALSLVLVAADASLSVR